MATELTINLSEPREKRMLLDLVRSLEGMHRIEICKHRKRRTDRQNAFYWPAFCERFAEYMRENGNTHWDKEMAHETFRDMFLKVSDIDEKTGIVYSRLRSTTDLDTQEFNEYLDKIAAVLATDCGITVEDPSVYHWKGEVPA